MRFCILCDYPHEPFVSDDDGPLCTVCAVRTTPEERRNYFRGQRIRLSYMDSD
jgi:predicted ATP-grasp superfamily ATP-dependent carboligase